MSGPTEFHLISAEDYHKLPGQSLGLSDLRKLARVDSTCTVCEGLPAWRLIGLGMCFPCTTGESDASDDYELAYEGETTCCLDGKISVDADAMQKSRRATMDAKRFEKYGDEWLDPTTAINGEMVWALIQRNNGQGNRFAMLAYPDSGEWTGVNGWDEHPNNNTFFDYGWTVVGYQAVVCPTETL